MEPRNDSACARCGYGIASRRAPDRCPMCGWREWLPIRRLAAREPDAARPAA